MLECFCVSPGRPKTVGPLVDGLMLQFRSGGIKSSRSKNVLQSARAWWLSEAAAPFVYFGAITKEANTDEERL